MGSLIIVQGKLTHYHGLSSSLIFLNEADFIEKAKVCRDSSGKLSFLPQFVGADK